MAITYGYVYVAQIAMGANMNHTIRTILEAESYPGPSPDHCLLTLHKPRYPYGYGYQHHAGEKGCGGGLLAPLQVQSPAQGGREEPLYARLQGSRRRL